MSLENKIIDETGLKELKLVLKKKKIVLCHGVFDLLHIGHINYFHAAKKIGDVLVVSVTDDSYVNKGPGRPAFTIQNRVKFLKEINCIDYICISRSLTSEKIIKNLKPDFYCKGPDYAGSIKIKKDSNLKKEIQALKSVKGKHQLVMNGYAKALEIIPKQLADNSGMDATDVLNKLRQKHAQEGEKGTWVGVNVLEGTVENLFDKFVWEPELVRINVL